MDHVEYELLVISVFPEPVTLTSVTVLDPTGKKLMRIEGGALTAATQTLFAHTESAVIPASAAVSVDVDLILPPNTVPERVHAQDCLHPQSRLGARSNDHQPGG